MIDNALLSMCHGRADLAYTALPVAANRLHLPANGAQTSSREIHSSETAQMLYLYSSGLNSSDFTARKACAINTAVTSHNEIDPRYGHPPESVLYRGPLRQMT